uniref:Large ribosomal subunit protein P2 n=1 Tax=Trichuris muris TaxID=70415 RepID=A0A5S6QMI3_TRIMR
MRYVAAYVLAVMGGNAKPDAAAIKKILDSVGIDFDEKRAKIVVEACSGHKVDDLINEGLKKLATVPTGGAAAPASPVSSAPAKGGKEPPPKEAAKKEESEEEDEDMGFSLFD